ncbi:methyltransferase domain-containing protein [Synechococcus sp. KORDI-49]|uniref:methyltransferase domain-containing protein n=1 Tax=Synechococcus sp. KORDI-49 TaxID=585423 RepID=UPI0009FE056F|nr:methyltransferase domain-containing protein [Synechococcus sp. KORDI-49]
MNFTTSLAAKSQKADFLLSRIKLLYRTFFRPNRTGGISGERYALELINRNLNLISLHMDIDDPKSLAVCEIGPGDSVALGYLWLAMGFSSYDAFDAFPYASIDKSREHANSVVNYLIDNYSKSPVLPYTVRNLRSFSPTINPLLKRLSFDHTFEKHISYQAPYSFDQIQANSYDIIYSQACFEHVGDLDELYASIYRALKPNGVLLTQIDFKSHGLSRLWNGHYRNTAEHVRNLSKSSHVYQWINGVTPTQHLKIALSESFEIEYQHREYLDSSFEVSDISENALGSGISIQDLLTESMTIVARK